MLEKYVLPERCCAKCNFGKPVDNNRIKCNNDDSYYFESRMAKKDHCPDFGGVLDKPQGNISSPLTGKEDYE